jgi:hypothetical protein
MEKMDLSRSTRAAQKKRSKLDRVYDKKPLIELVVAILSIPSLILVVLLNFNSLKNLDAAKLTPTPGTTNTVPPLNTNTTNPNFFARPVTREPQSTEASSNSQAPCNKSLGLVNITSPNEGDTVNSNPVEIDISYDDTDYCSAVWSYSINGSSWSDYNNNSVALYNLPDGQIKFQLRVKSLTSSNSTTLTRDFTYTGQSTAPVPTTASGSAH